MLSISLLFTSFLFVSLSASGSTQSPFPPPPHICLIGGGITSASAAHFLSQLSPPPQLTLFEQTSRLGGRIRTLHLPHPVEAGASIIASSNALMRHFVSLLGLRATSLPLDNRLGLWNGHSFVLRLDGPWYRDIFALLRRYGLAPLRIRWHVSRLVRLFGHVYPSDGVAGKWRACETMECLMARSGELFALSQRGFEGDMVERYGQRFVDEFVAAITLVNYGQLPESMHALAGAIALAGSGGGVWAVAGGTEQVVQGLLRRANVTLRMGERVEKVEKVKGGYVVKVETKGEVDERCDAVVLGVSAELAEVEMPGGGNGGVGRKFKRTVATFVEGRLNERRFGRDAPEGVLCVKRAGEVFRSIGRVWESEGRIVWKVFSDDKLSRGEVDSLFQGGKVVAEFDWKAYPEFEIPERWGQWAEGVVQAGGLEGGASAMEMGAVGGANAAAVVMDKLGLGARGTKADKEEL